jgi:CRP-like cAMP-binding protein
MPYPTRVLASALPSSEAHVPDRERQCLQALHSSLFAKLPPAVLRKLANSYPARSYGAAELVLQQGAPIRELSLILQGEAELLWQRPGGSSPLTVGILGPGECFGESVVQLRKASSQTTVRARTDLLLLQIDTDNLASLADLHPYLARELHAVGELRCQAMASLQRELV